MNAQYNNANRVFRDIEGQQITAAKQIHGRAAVGWAAGKHA